MGDVLLEWRGKNWSRADLEAPPRGATPFEEALFAFYAKWFAGETHFTVPTSGTTGRPKFITFERDQLEASARLTNEALALHPGMTALLCLDTRYIAGLMMVVRSLVGRMLLVAEEPVAHPLAALDRHLDFAALVPYQLKSILDSPQRERLNRISCLLLGGAETDALTVDRLQAYDCRAYATFGMTETLTHIALRKLNGEDRSPNFTTLPGVSIRQDPRGCLVISAGHLSAEVVTNDLVDMLDTRTFKWLGRVDNVINSGGVKVNAEWVENTLRPLLPSTEFFICGRADAKLGEHVTLVIQGEAWEAGRLASFREQAAHALSPYECPREFLFLGRFLFTPTGKIDRKNTQALLTIG